MDQPCRTNALIVKRVGMLPGASAEYASLSMNVQHIYKIQAAILTQPHKDCNRYQTHGKIKTNSSVRWSHCCRYVMLIPNCYLREPETRILTTKV
ncbi:MAG: hypothetical protein K2F70_00020 [Muribaculaceae bacterium]|nr:hypothetical protein [Muribaculaceae bacterium]